MASALMKPFEVAMQRFVPPNANIVVGLSGGADSVALCLLLQQWAKQHSASLTAVTVNHGLRAEATIEATSMKKWCDAEGIEHSTLNITMDKSKPVMEAARHARYGALRAYCELHNAPVLMVAHHLNDQAETLLMRITRSSGSDGLACMQPTSSLGSGVSLVRPLLSVPKSSLEEYLQSRRVDWIVDPTNADLRYLRTKARAVVDDLIQVAPGGLDVVSEVVEAWTGVRDERQVAVEAILASPDFRLTRPNPNEMSRAFSVVPLRSMERGTAMRVLSTVYASVSSSEYPVGRRVLEQVFQQIVHSKHKTGNATVRLGDTVFTGPRRGLCVVRRTER